MTAIEIVYWIRGGLHRHQGDVSFGYTHGYLDDAGAVALIEADRKVVRKECADRAIKWLPVWLDQPDREEIIRSAIMGEE